MDVIEEVDFDHGAAWRAMEALERAIIAVRSAAQDREAVVDDVLSRCEGPFAEGLRRELHRSVEEARSLWLALDRLRDAIAAARHQAVIDEELRKRATGELWYVEPIG